MTTGPNVAAIYCRATFTNLSRSTFNCADAKHKGKNKSTSCTMERVVLERKGNRCDESLNTSTTFSFVHDLGPNETCITPLPPCIKLAESQIQIQSKYVVELKYAVLTIDSDRSKSVRNPARCSSSKDLPIFQP
uniref:Uncharacterized protein n=1 Tax=Palpitomonas bilix TaxID=652834 RepID=A0A7S3GE37_9EUKA